MRRRGRSILVVAESRDDRRVLFDALDGLAPGEILSARDAAHAHALLRKGRSPVLAIVDFEHALDEALSLCAELSGAPVIGVFGAAFGAGRLTAAMAAECNIQSWLRAPVDAAEAELRIREVLVGARPEAAADAPEADVSASGDEPDAGATPLPAMLHALAGLLQSGRDSAGWSGLLPRAMDMLAMDLMIVAERDAAEDALRPLARMDRLSEPGTADPLGEGFVQQALRGEAVVQAGGWPADAQGDAFMRATGCTRYAALPLFDTHRNVLGVMVCASRRADAPADGLLQSMLDIVASRFAAVLELRAERERGRNRALLDGLTGLPNRMLFNDRLESALQDARRTGEVFAVLFVDLDRFKGINDSLGHGVGDQVLVAEAHRLQALLRASDTVARYAGDEFTAILRHVDDRADIAVAAAKVLHGMQAPLILDNGSELQVTASIGVSIFPDDAGDAEGLIRHADMAMYNAKGQGRNQVQAFGSAPGEAHRQRLEMESRLRDAEANGELCVHYQPQVDIASEAVVAVEALLRWRHPVLGMLSPGFFMPLAEESGLIIPIGEWALRRACADVAEWQRRSPEGLRLAVNLSALQWMSPNLVTMIESVCREAGLSPRMLDLEASESALANPPPELAGVLRALREIGCRIVIDDAGAGRLTSKEEADGLPADAIKIDQGFIHNIGSDPDDEAVITSLLDTARGEGRRVVAEGVETERQLEFLRERGCEAAQGYLFCRPLEAAALGDLLAARPDPANGGETRPIRVSA
ncbi:MAG TPA: EAL domain-containing protein [Rhodanobacteraceae bacterium]|nr:EAL domain-containing protein [Rhodanobacteraceae bacterium]